MNLLPFRRPTNIALSDACPRGMGGFSIKTGKAWRFQMPATHNLINNTLKGMVSVVTIWIEHLHEAVPLHGNTFALTDNSGCVGWLHWNNFSEDTHPVEAAIAHQLADCCNILCLGHGRIFENSTERSAS
jgi:hypothetical protein